MQSSLRYRAFSSFSKAWAWQCSIPTPCEAIMTPLPISDHCHAIKKSLNDFGGQPSDARDKVADLIARFQLWAGNLGAFHHPSQKLSLDARVAQSPEIRDEILRHLQDIEQTSSECKYNRVRNRFEPLLNKFQLLISFTFLL